MNYEKAYKEALERAKSYHDDPNCFKHMEGCLEHIFPELKESEDERIRKELLNAFQESEDSLYMVLTPHRRESFIAWLEKQGKTSPILSNSLNIGKVEQKPAWSEEDEKFVHGLIRGLAAKRDIHGHTTFSSDCIDITQTINWLKSLKDRVQPQQEWSEEDEHKFKVVVNALVEDYEATPELINWFNSLKERVQPKQEWSEEDCNQIETIVCHLDNIGNGAMAESLLNIMDKYKSLRPQKLWKPSEEQMKSLEQAARYYNCGKIKLVGTHLNEIIEQLKALK